LKKLLLTCLLLLFWTLPVLADSTQYQVEIEAPTEIKELLQKHLDMVKWRDNPRMNPAEWQRLYLLAPQNIKNLVATEGYFSPKISPSLENKNGVFTAKFAVDSGSPVLISDVDLKFTGDINQQQIDDKTSIPKLRDAWLLKTGEPFRQDDWDQAKRKLLTTLLVERFPNATISNSRAEVNLENQTVALTVEIDSGSVITFGETTIEGLERYPASVVENLNPIKPSSIYNQSDLLTFQARLQESGYFQSVAVSADTQLADSNIAPIKVTVVENRSVKMGIGAGYSTNTGARTQLTYDDLNILNRGWRLISSLKLEQKAQSIGGEIKLPVTSKGYRDSFNASLNRSAIEGQTLTTSQVGVKRAWGPRKREQYIGSSYLVEQQDVDGGESTTKKVGVLSYGITLRRTDNELSPTRGYLFNAQFSGAPLDALSDGKFLQSYFKTQAYYPITRNTQLIGRAEFGMVNGKNSAPEAFLFRAGGDQSVRGYAFQSLGINEGDAIVGGRYLATGSVEVVQWLTNQWGAAAFVDFGNAANRIQDLDPVYGYGLGARWKSPIGPIGADIAYGEATSKYRLHFNIGVAF
jgi:translocation and assembly module TamA